MSQLKESFEIINIVFIYSEQVYGTVENFGAYASNVKFSKNGIDYEETIDNDDFVILDEIVFTHIEEE